jgi:integrase
MVAKKEKQTAERKRGTITRKGRNGVWMVRVYTGKKEVAGKQARQYVSKVIHGTYRQADQERTKMLGDLDAGTFIAPAKQTLGEYLENWLTTSAALRVSIRVLSSYRGMITNHVLPTVGHTMLDKVSASQLQSLYATLADRPRTMHYVHSVLKSALKQAVQFRLIPFNPAEGVSVPGRVSQQGRTILTAAQVARIVAEVKTERHGALWALLLNTGLRPQEALALKWEDLKDGKLTIARALVKVSSARWELGPTKTKSSRRVLSVPRVALDALAVHKVRQAAQILKGGIGYARNDLIFATKWGTQISPPTAYRSWLVMLRRLNIPPCMLYTTRHTHASLLLAAGWPVKAVSERLGHASAKMTLDVYCHTLPETDGETAVAFERLIQAAAGG